MGSVHFGDLRLQTPSQVSHTAQQREETLQVRKDLNIVSLILSSGSREQQATQEKSGWLSTNALLRDPWNKGHQAPWALETSVLVHAFSEPWASHL